MKKELLDQHNAQADQLGISNLFLRQLPSISNELLRILLVLAHFDQRFGHHPDFDGNVTPSLLEQMTGLNLHSVIRGLDERIKASLITFKRRDGFDVNSEDWEGVCFYLGNIPRTYPPTLRSLIGWMNCPSDSATPGIVYVLHDGHGLYKIGKTKNLNQRLKAYETHSSRELEIIARFEVIDIAACESDLHKRFGYCRERGEWFSLSESDIQWVKDWEESIKSWNEKGLDSSTD